MEYRKNLYDINENKDYDKIKILYKEFIRCFKCPNNTKTSNNLKIYCLDMFAAYLTVSNVSYTLTNNSYFNTPDIDYYIFAEKDEKKLNQLFNYIKTLKKRSLIVLMLESEYLEIDKCMSLKVLKFSNLFKTMTKDKLIAKGLDIRWLNANGFFK